jgi:hypothetical protein
MYPLRALSKVLNISEEMGDHFTDLSPMISNKIVLAKSIAEEMTLEETLEFPYIKAIMQWWERD